MAALALGQLPGDGQAEAGAAPPVQRDEAFEGLALQAGGEAGAVVVDRHDDAVALGRHPELDHGTGVAPGVVEQVAQDLRGGVGVQHDQRRDAVADRQPALGHRQLAGPFDLQPAQLGDVDRAGTERLPLVEPGRAQQRRRQAAEPAGLTGQVGQQPLLGRGGALDQQGVDGGPQGGDRRPQLVGGGGQEGPAAGLGLPGRPE